MVPTEVRSEMFAVMVLEGVPNKSLQQMILCSTQQSTERGQTSLWGGKKKKDSLESEELLNLMQSSHETFSMSPQMAKY